MIADPLNKKSYEYALSAFYLNELESVIEFFPNDGGEFLRHFSGAISCTGVARDEHYKELVEKYPEATWVEYGNTRAKYDMVLAFNTTWLGQKYEQEFINEFLRHEPRIIIIGTPFQVRKYDGLYDPLKKVGYEVFDYPVIQGGLGWIKVICRQDIILPH